MHGWLGHGNKEELQRVMDNPNVNIICELGIWYGKSAEFFLVLLDIIFLTSINSFSLEG